MITLEGLVTLAYLKKSPITGSYEGMRYKLSKSAGEDGKLECVYWPEPFNFLKTAEEEKTYKNFEFSDEGIDFAVEWLNSEWAEHQEKFRQAAKWSSEWF